jgi:hypothetical protein
MTHAKVKLAVAAAVAATVVTPVVWQENAIARVRADNRALAAKLEAGDQTVAAPAAPAATVEADSGDRDGAELERLRNEVGSLRNQLEQARAARLAAASAPSTSEKSRPAPMPGLVSLNDARNVGAATPEALFQTFVWAMRNADTNRMIELGDWSAEGARAQAEEMLSEFPKLIASGELEREAADKGFRLVRQVSLPDGDTAVVMDMVDMHGETRDVHRMAARVRRVGSEWRIVMDKQGPEEVKLPKDQMGD